MKKIAIIGSVLMGLKLLQKPASEKAPESEPIGIIIF